MLFSDSALYLAGGEVVWLSLAPTWLCSRTCSTSWGPKRHPKHSPPHLSIACTHTICFRFTKFRLIKQPGFASSLPRSDLPVGEKQCKFSFSQAKGRALEYPLGSKATKEENEALNPHHVEQGASRLVVVIPLPSNL